MRILFIAFVLTATASEAIPQAISTNLPTDVQAKVQRLGCQIPEDQSIARGHFERADATNWAVLCSKEGTTVLVVFADGGPLGSTAIHRTFNGDGQRLTVRHVSAVDRRFILKHCSSARQKVAIIDHQGILDGFNRSVVHYYFQGRWIAFPVTDPDGLGFR
jgi:hypothetical protein